MRGDLNEAGSFWKIERRVPNLREEEGVDAVVVLEVFQDPKTLCIARGSINESLTLAFGICLKA